MYVDALKPASILNLSLQEGVNIVHGLQLALYPGSNYAGMEKRAGYLQGRI